MKLTDWCILFVALFLCVILPLDLRTGYLSQSFCQQKKYERVLDRACMDSLVDSVIRENDDGSVVVDERQVHGRFRELLGLEFDAVSREEREYLQQCIRMQQFYHLERVLTPVQADAVRMQMEQAAADSNYDMWKKNKQLLSFYFPYIPQEEWYQNLAGPSLYSLFEADSSADPWEKYRRYVFSGGRIVKQVPEAESEAVQSGFY